MKIIDCHTHLPGTHLDRRAISGAGQLRKEFESEGLSGSWIMTTDGLLGEPVKNNDILARETKDHRDFFTPFCTVSPHQGKEAALIELERCARQLKMSGLKLHPWLQAFSLTHPVVLPILKKAGELNFPVLFHDGSPPYSTPLQIAAAAEKVPNTTIILGHSGLDDLYEDAILACLRHPNIYLCLCSLSAGPIREIINRCPPEKLLYGSDAGFAPNAAKLAISKLLASGTSEEVLKKIFWDNAKRILGEE